MASAAAPPSTRAKVFRYRFVGYGTRFTPAAGFRAPGDHANPSALYENELAVDVGGRAWAIDGETAAIFDHHFAGGDPPPCAAVAVLQRAAAIRERFRRCESDVLWLVAHREPDFDSFSAMYLARWIIEEDEPVEVATAGVDWFSPRIGMQAPPRVRWALQLAGYAACVDHARRTYSARNEALHSVLYAALSRGRPYCAEESGALEFFTEVRARLCDGANPQCDSVLAGSATFAPELAMLLRENEHYERDVSRARTAIVFAPVTPPEFARVYARTCATPLREAGEGEPSELGRPGARRAVDGIYIRDPDCLLFKEWARIDDRNSTFGHGFTFTCIAFSDEAGGATAYYASLDPESGRDLHLYPLWERLQRRELAALRAAGADPSARAPRAGFESRAGANGGLFDDPWYDGGTYSCRIVVSPNRGTALGPPGTRSDLIDDPVAGEVREELENWAYASALRTHDEPAISGTKASDAAYRFARVELNDAVDVLNDAMAAQVAARLWCTLFDTPETSVAPDILRDCTFRRNGLLAIWSRRGVAVAHAAAARAAADRLEQQFREIVEVGRNLDAICGLGAGDLAQRVKSGEELMKRMGRLRRELAVADGEVIEGFVTGAGFERVLQTFRDVNRAEALAFQTNQVMEHTRTVADVQVKVEWLELLFVAIYATEVGHIISDAVAPQFALVFTMICSVVLTVGAALYLRPWEHEPEGARRGVTRPFIVGGLLIVVVGILLGCVQAGWIRPPAPMEGAFRADATASPAAKP